MSAHMWLDFKKKNKRRNLRNFSTQLRLRRNAHTRDMACTFPPEPLSLSFSQLNTSIERSKRIPEAFDSSKFFFLSKYFAIFSSRLHSIWNKRMSRSLLCSVIDFLRLPLEKKVNERMRYLKHKRHLFGCDLILAAWLLYFCVLSKAVSLEFKQFFHSFFFTLTLPLTLLKNAHWHFNSLCTFISMALTYALKTSTPLNLIYMTKFRHIWYDSSELCVHFWILLVSILRFKMLRRNEKARTEIENEAKKKKIFHWYSFIIINIMASSEHSAHASRCYIHIYEVI